MCIAADTCKRSRVDEKKVTSAIRIWLKLFERRYSTLCYGISHIWSFFTLSPAYTIKCGCVLHYACDGVCGSREACMCNKGLNEACNFVKVCVHMYEAPICLKEVIQLYVIQFPIFATLSPHPPPNYCWSQIFLFLDFYSYSLWCNFKNLRCKKKKEWKSENKKNLRMKIWERKNLRMKSLRMKKSENENLRIKKSENEKSETNYNLVEQLRLKLCKNLRTCEEHRTSAKFYWWLLMAPYLNLKLMV